MAGGGEGLPVAPGGEGLPVAAGGEEQSRPPSGGGGRSLAGLS
ncbi:MAG TPA: hypothetical protein VG365_14900 [Solirubrobacteraceae bacterium]|nr:hypothetical protein [Solirubrobacteraceae bacterium]